MHYTSRKMATANVAKELAAGLTSGFLGAITYVSYGALIFSGTLVEFLPIGIGLSLLSGIVLRFVCLLAGIFPGSVVGPASAATAVSAVVAAEISSEMIGASPHTLFVTLFAALSTIALLSGCVMFLLAKFRVSSLVQYLPFPVIGGFLAGTGWLLVEGSATIMTDVGLLDLLRSMANETPEFLHWLPGFLFAIVLLAATRRWSHPAIMPVGLVLAVVIFYLTVWLAGIDLAGAGRDGWLLGPFPAGTLIHLVGPSDLEAVDWFLIAQQAPEIVTIVIIGVITVSLTVSGLELQTGEEIDLDREFRALGLANIASGLTGGVVGWHSPAQSALAHSIGGVQNRVSVLISIAALAIVLLAGPPVLALLPRLVIGGLVCFLGLSFLHEWLYRARRRLSLGDYIVVLTILCTIGTVGILLGVAVGLGISVVLFVTEYSRTGVIRHVLTGVTCRSNVMRRPEHEQILDNVGESVLVLKLQGFLFFGTSHRLLNRVRDRLVSTEAPPLKFLVLDVGFVTDADSSALTTFTRLRNLAIQGRFQIVYSALTKKFMSQLQEAGASVSNDPLIHIAENLDYAMEYCEDTLLSGQTKKDIASGLVEQLTSVFTVQSNAERIRDYFTPMEFADGATVIQQGDSADGLYYLQAGRLIVFLELPGGGRRRLSAVREGAILGEMGLYSGAQRSTSVVADGVCRMFHLSLENFKTMQRDNPELATELDRYVIRLLSQRLRHAVQQVGSLT